MRAVTATMSAVRHSLGALAEALLIVAIGVALVAALAPVYKPVGWFVGSADARGKPSTNSVTISVNDGRFGGNTVGQVSGSGASWVDVVCTLSDGSIGMTSWVKPDATGSISFGLGPTPSWSAGGASCTAIAGYYSSNGRWRALASTTFTVYAV